METVERQTTFWGGNLRCCQTTVKVRIDNWPEKCERQQAN